MCLFSFTSENFNSIPLASDVCGCSSSFFCHELLLSAFLNHSPNSHQEGDKNGGNDGDDENDKGDDNIDWRACVI